jgi:hypothetical protein
MLHCLGIWQLITGRGPADCTHWPGKENLMGNILSRSFKEGFPKGTDNQFLAHFTNHFPLPTLFTPNSQPGSWKLVTPLSGIIPAVISCCERPPTATIGNSGYAIPRLVTRTLTSSTYKENPTAWNKVSCSWPLLDPSSKVNSTVVANLLPLWSSRLCYEKSPGSWTVGGLATLGAALRDSPSWTHPSVHWIAEVYGTSPILRRHITLDLVVVAYFFLQRVGIIHPDHPAQGAAQMHCPSRKGGHHILAPDKGDPRGLTPPWNASSKQMGPL